MYCNMCGRRLEENDKFCPNCGKKRDIQSSNVGSKRSNSWIKTLAIGIGAFFAVALLVLLFGFVLCFPDPQSGESISGLTFDIFGSIAGVFSLMGFVLIIILVVMVILNAIKNNKSI